MKTAVQLLLSFGLSFSVPLIWAADQLVSLPLARSGVSTSYWWMPRDGAQTTVLLISGGAGGMGFEGKEPKSDNFLVRTRELFAAKGFNVAVLGLSTDMRDLTQEVRTSSEHAQDVLAVVKAI
ncbi:MAG: alpha/beta hydrolase, partial [Polaromonas sp.]|nr:alpha/beta hydrolase [Polaromonas sp.]